MSVPVNLGVQATDGSAHRLVSLDVMRGLVIAAMILVTDPGTYSHVYPQLLHAAWNGATATDMIFPAFLLMSGVAVPYAIAARSSKCAPTSRIVGHTLRRVAALIILGLAVNGFPAYHWSTLRFPGILQRIALCYGITAIFYLFLLHPVPGERRFARSLKRIIPACIALLTTYWLILQLAPVPDVGAGHLDSFGSYPAYLDRTIFGIDHLWPWGLTPGRGVTYDPEGLLSTLPALCFPLLGVMAGVWLMTKRSRSVRAWVLAGAGLMSLGLAFAHWMPLNKRLMTPSFTLFSAGVVLMILFFLYWLIDVAHRRHGLTVWLVFGTNAILAFVVASVITSLLGLPMMDGIRNSSPHQWVYDHLLAVWLPPRVASLAFAAAVVALNGLLLYPLFRRRIVVRI